MAKTVTFRNRYNTIGKKEEFFIEPDKTEMTDQSQICSASITEMAKKFGIDAIIAKAEQQYVDENVQNQLYGHDFTNMFHSTEERLNVKNRLTNVFEKIPARIRKEQFNDSVANFVDAYITNDENKLTTLNKLGIVSDTQLNQVKTFNQRAKEARAEAENRKAFIDKLETMKEGLYETYKSTGNITLDSSQNGTTNS